MSSEVDDYGLRDKFAIEILQAFISREGQSTANLVAEFMKGHEYDDPYFKREGEEKMEALIRAAYKVADMMRKVRLTAFE
jgi:hypothetical protein